MNDMNEYTFRNEAEAHRVRREYINAGYSVSLVGYDTSREVYVFDILN